MSGCSTLRQAYTASFCCLHRLHVEVNLSLFAHSFG